MEIPRLEKRRDELHLLLADAADDYEKAQVLSEELTAVMTRLDEAEMRWLELAERSEASS